MLIANESSYCKKLETWQKWVCDGEVPTIILFLLLFRVVC